MGPRNCLIFSACRLDETIDGYGNRFELNEHKFKPNSLGWVLRARKCRKRRRRQRKFRFLNRTRTNRMDGRPNREKKIFGKNALNVRIDGQMNSNLI